MYQEQPKTYKEPGWYCRFIAIATWLRFAFSIWFLACLSMTIKEHDIKIDWNFGMFAWVMTEVVISAGCVWMYCQLSFFRAAKDNHTNEELDRFEYRAWLIIWISYFIQATSLVAGFIIIFRYSYWVTMQGIQINYIRLYLIF